MLNLEGFKAYLIREKTARGKFRKLKTIELYLTCLQRLHKSCPDLTLPQVSRYLLDLYDQGRKGTYINDFVDVMHLYGRFLEISDYDELKYWPEEKFVAGILEDIEIEAFLKLPPPTVRRYHWKSKKYITYLFSAGWATWNMFWMLCAYHPVRLGEIAHLTVDNIDFGLRKIDVDGKTGEREVAIHSVVLEPLREYIKNLETDQLFPSLRGGQNRQGGVVDDVDWGKSFHDRIRRLQIKRKNLRPYSLRHSSITRLANGKVNPFLLMEMAGQSDLRTTLQYYHGTLRAKHEAMKSDSLSRKTLPIYEKCKYAFAQWRELMDNLALDPNEEREMTNYVLRGNNPS